MQNRLPVMETKVQSLGETRNRLATLETIVNGHIVETSSLVTHVNDLNNRSRRNNVIIRGISEDENEKGETIGSKVKDEILSATLEVNATY